MEKAYSTDLAGRISRKMGINWLKADAEVLASETGSRDIEYISLKRVDFFFKNWFFWNPLIDHLCKRTSLVLLCPTWIKSEVVWLKSLKVIASRNFVTGWQLVRQPGNLAVVLKDWHFAGSDAFYLSFCDACFRDYPNIHPSKQWCYWVIVLYPCVKDLLGLYRKSQREWSMDKRLNSEVREAILFSCVAGGATIPAGAGGTFLGGYLVKRLHLNCTGTIRLCVICSCFALGSVFLFLIKCSNEKVAGVNWRYDDRWSSPSTQGKLSVAGGTL